VRVIRRYQVPTGAGWKERTLRGPVLHVGARDPDVVEFWAVYDEMLVSYRRDFQVITSEVDVPRNAIYHGSVVWRASVNHGDEVWHLISRFTR
jgi:hypothetical protein